MTNGTITVGRRAARRQQRQRTVTLSGTAAAINTALASRELHRQQRLPWQRQLTATTTDGAEQLGGAEVHDHGCGYGGDIGNADGTLSGSENAAISLAGISVADATELRATR